MTNNRKFSQLFYFFACVFLTSCIYDNFDENFDPDHFGDEELAEIQKGYSLSLTVTLDKMGGTAATRVNALSSKELMDLEEIENYINPERFRVLFFDDKDRFLFESKSRWVKRLSEKDDFTTWFVSVPVFPYGNDMDYDWDWPEIRKALTKEDEDDPKTFKIAILANRPLDEWTPQFKDTGIEPDWFDNSGPHWDKKDTGVKSVFDLHHCQYDPIYTGKSWTGDRKDMNQYEGVYEFIAGYDPSLGDKQWLTMGSTSSWVDWGTKDDDNRDPYGWDLRYFKAPSRDYPIPMYGIQEFDAIMDWTAGTPFNLSEITSPTLYNVKSVSMLRSVVKLELLVPKSVGTINTSMIFYPNIYARCEPMDVWTPTDKIWRGLHGEDDEWGDGFVRKDGEIIYDDEGNPEQYCEWKSIWNYGRITKNGDPTDVSSSFKTFRERISWFYGAWNDIDPATIVTDEDGNVIDKGQSWWNFQSQRGKGFGAVTLVDERKVGDNNPIQYPRVFNPCTQRNNLVLCDKVFYDDDDFYHFVVYTGERNINDPSDILNLGDNGGGKPTVIYWMINVEKNGDQKTYAIPIIDYDKIPANNSPAKTVEYKFAPNTPNNKPTQVLHDYELSVFNGDIYLPWPLIRNHVYRLTLTPKPGTTRSGDDGTIAVHSEEMHSESIRFY